MNKTQTSSRFGVASKGAAIVLSATLLASSFSFLGSTFVAPEVDAAGSSVDFMVDDQQDGSILQCFNWSFTAIKNNMAKIAEQGFTAVQTSPIQTAKEGTAGKTAKGSWWVQYQPADFTIETNANGTGALGTATEFRAMCDEAHKYGVRVIVDAVLNHMANQSKNDLSSAIPSKYRNNSNFWHDIKKNSWYESRYDITQFCMDGLPDLNTGSSDVQNAATAFLKECIDCGADGFRFDGAKHIEVPVDSGFGSQFWPNVLGATTSYAQSTRGITPYYYGEVLDKPTGDSDISNAQNVANSYSQYMSVTMSGVSNSIRGSVNSGDAQGAKRSDYNFDGAGSISGNKAVLWNESHDTYQAGHSSGVSDYKVNQTWALVGSRATSCGMYLARPSNWGSAMMGQGDVTAWANTEVKAVNEFNNAFVGQTEYLSSSGSIAYNERGTTGAVLVNVSGGATSVSVAAHKMVAGDYVDQITGSTFKVEGGQIKGNIGSTGIAVVYNAGPVIKSAVVSASPAGGSFTTTVTATLNVKNAASGSYTTSDGKSGTYSNGDTITFGSNVAIGGSVTLTLKATGEDGVEKTQTYTFTKKDPSAVTTIYFDNTSYKWSNVYAYIYAGGTGTESSSDPVPGGQIIFSDTLGWGNVNAYFFNDSGAVGTGWPGSTMDYNGTNDYGQKQFKISVPSGATKVIFNNGNGTQTGNVVLTGATGYYCDGSPDNVKSWTSSGSGAATVTENAKWPGVKMEQDASTGYYAYVVPENLVNGKVVFSDGVEGTTNRYPVSETAGGLAINDTSMIFKAGNTWEPYTVVPVPPDPETLVNNSTVSKSRITVGQTVTLTGAASGGTAPYTFCYQYNKSGESTWNNIGTAFGTATSASFKPSVAGSFNLRVTVQDGTGTKVAKKFSLTVDPSASTLVNNSTSSATTVNVNGTVTLKGAATGGATPYKFAYFYKLASRSSWKKASDGFVSDKSVAVKFNNAGSYNLMVRVRDNTGKMADKTFDLTVTGSPLTNNSSLSATSIELGSSVTLKGAATGGTTPYTYFYAYKLSTASSYTRVTSSFVSATSKTITPDKSGKYDVLIKVKDAAGTVAEKKLTLNVTNAALTNNSKVGASSIALGNSITLKGVATGGTTPYTYFFAYKLSTNGSYTRATSDFVSSQTVTIKPTAKGTYDVLIKVKDAAGTVVAKNLTFKVT